MRKNKLDSRDISISPRFQSSDWLAALAAEDWKNMVVIFHDRLEGRFLKAIRLIGSNTTVGNFAGFSILALDCLIIETLHQFYLGIDETGKDHKKWFWWFFKNSEFFKDHFSQKTSDIFYSHFRCGLLHQAQTKGRSLIRADQNRMIQPIGDSASDGLIVDRRLFHAALEKEISAYKIKLMIGGKESLALRTNFVRKMRFICEV